VCASRYVYVCARHNHTLMRGYLLQRHIHTCLHAPVFHIQPPLNEVGEGVRARERERRRGTEGGGGGKRNVCWAHTNLSPCASFPHTTAIWGGSWRHTRATQSAPYIGALLYRNRRLCRPGFKNKNQSSPYRGSLPFRRRKLCRRVGRGGGGSKWRKQCSNARSPIIEAAKVVSRPRWYHPGILSRKSVYLLSKSTGEGTFETFLQGFGFGV
jgi:hypothetical protein